MMHTFSSLYESFTQYRNYALQQLRPGTDPTIIDDLITRFRTQVSRGTISGNEKDINYWKTQSLDDFTQAIKSAESKTTKRQQKQNAKHVDGIRVGKFGQWQAIIPTSVEASKCYGADTKWCTASKATDKHFSDYQNSNTLLIYLVPDDSVDDGKWALVIDPMYGNVTDIFDEMDDFKTVSEFEKFTGLSAKKIADAAVQHNKARLEKLEKFAGRNYHAALRYVMQSGGDPEKVKDALLTTPDGGEIYLDLGGKDVDAVMNNIKFPTGEFARNYRFQLSGIARKVPPEKWSDLFKRSMKDAAATQI